MSTQECPICQCRVSGDIEAHVMSCLGKHSDVPSVTECPYCMNNFPQSQIERHALLCSRNFDNVNNKKMLEEDEALAKLLNEQQGIPEPIPTPTATCPLCFAKFATTRDLEKHAASCGRDEEMITTVECPLCFVSVGSDDIESMGTISELISVEINRNHHRTPQKMQRSRKGESYMPRVQPTTAISYHTRAHCNLHS